MGTAVAPVPWFGFLDGIRFHLHAHRIAEAGSLLTLGE